MTRRISKQKPKAEDSGSSEKTIRGITDSRILLEGLEGNLNPGHVILMPYWDGPSDCGRCPELVNKVYVRENQTFVNTLFYNYPSKKVFMTIYELKKEDNLSYLHKSSFRPLDLSGGEKRKVMDKLRTKGLLKL